MMKIFSIILSVVLLFSMIGCAGKSNPWLNQDEHSVAAQKLKSTKRAIVRYQQAENAAVRDGDEESAAAYRKARENLLEELPALQQRYDALEAERQAFLEKQQENFMNRDE